MKNHHIVSLLQTGYTTVQIVFAAATERNQEPRWETHRNYTYKAKLSAGISVDDLVVVHAPFGFKIVKVVAVHDFPQIDTDVDFEYKWIVQKLDTTEYEATVEAETQFKRSLQDIERRKQAQSVVESLTSQYSDPLIADAFRKAVGNMGNVIEVEALPAPVTAPESTAT